jgi:hypothetical protein
MAYTKYSLTPSSNTAAPPDGAPEGMLPSAVNDTMRDMMSQIRDCGDGIRDGTYTMTAAKITGGSITGVTFTSIIVTGGSISGVTLTDPAITGTILEDIYTISDGAAFEIDPSNGSIQLITLGASRTPKATNFANGESVLLMVDDGSAYTLTWTDATFGASGVVWKTNAGVAPTLNTTGYTAIVLWEVASQIYGARVGDA